jgi:DNA polymerase III subunit epsilon
MSVMTNWFGTGRNESRMRPKRIVSIDLETSGLDTKRDVIISIAGVAIVEGEVCVADGFEIVVQQETVSAAANVPLAQAFSAFEAWRNGAPMLGWRIGFDYAFLSRAAKALQLNAPDDDTLCVAELAAALAPSGRASLDEHAAALGMLNEQRHDAAADAWVTALVFTHFAARAEKEGVRSYQALRSLAKQARWLN